MIIEKIELEKHFKILKEWWLERGAEVPFKEFFPKTGFIISGDNGVRICAGFLFKTDGNIAIINHIVSNPLPMEKKVRDQAMDLIIEALVSEAMSCDFKLVTAASNVEKLNERYEKHGFIKSDTNETHFGRRI